MLCSNMPKSVVPWGLIFDSMNIIPRSFINFPRRSLWARLRICLLCDSDGHTWHVFHKSCAKEWWPGQRIHGRIWQDGEDGKPMAWSKKKSTNNQAKTWKMSLLGKFIGESCVHHVHHVPISGMQMARSFWDPVCHQRVTVSTEVAAKRYLPLVPPEFAHHVAGLELQFGSPSESPQSDNLDQSSLTTPRWLTWKPVSCSF